MADFLIRYGTMRFQGVFAWNSARQVLRRGDYVIIRTDRGLEIGQVLCDATENVIEELPKNTIRGDVVRLMTSEDAHEYQRIRQHETEEFQICLNSIEKLHLEMHLVDVEHIFGGERIVVYYLADGRIDFRELVKVLASEFQTRIEMRQIGVRDEAKLLADYGDCGKEICCNTYLTVMPPVSMRMAKLQKATLDPSKISGRCGRLKCCLRYEYPTYEEYLAELPPVGARVRHEGNSARVIGVEILARQVYIEGDDKIRKLVPLEEVTLLERKRSSNRLREETDEEKRPEKTEE